MSSETRDPADDVVVDVRGVSKAYRMYARPSDRFRQALLWGRRKLFREFWALRDVSLQIRRGEIVGVIGRNGSGKSTLLQLIAGTLTPTEGEIRIRGRVAALLELGSGFHADATGRENVYMNGVILGLSTAQIEKRYESIVAFADIGEFIDQPIRTYSSGMFVRLAFAVASHVDADVLIVDEALAVGDEGFQRKCFARLEQFQAGGGTVLFVTHGTQTIVKLCRRAVLLDHGAVLAIGPSKPVADAYQKLLYGTPAQTEALRDALRQVQGRVEALAGGDALAAPGGEIGATAPEGDGRGPSGATSASRARGPGPQPFFDPALMRPPETSYGTGQAVIEDVAFLDEQGRAVNVLVAGVECALRYTVRFHASVDGVRFGIMIKTVEGVDVAGVSSAHFGRTLAHASSGQVLVVRFLLRLNVAPGVYFVNCGVSSMRDGGETYLHRRVDTAAIRVIGPDEREMYGLAFLDPRFEVRAAADVEHHA